MLNRLLLTTAAAAALAACGTAPNATNTDDGRVLSGLAPAGSERVLVIDADGAAFDAVPGADGRFSIAIASQAPVSLFVVGNGLTRVLRVAPSPGAAPSATSLPDWQGEVSTAQLSTCDCNEDGVDEEVLAEDNPLDQIDTDGDGELDFEDADDDNDGVADDEDDDGDDSGRSDDDEDLDGDDDGRPDLCDDDDDDDGVGDDDDDDDGDYDDDGVSDDDDEDDDNDGDGDDDDDDDHDDGDDDGDEDEAGDDDGADDAGDDNTDD